MGSNGRTSTSSTTDMVKIHVAVIAILSTLYISTQARNVGQYAEEPMDRMKSLGLVVDYLAQDPKFVNILAKTLYDFQDEMLSADPELRRSPSKKNSELLNSLLGLPKHSQKWINEQKIVKSIIM